MLLEHMAEQLEKLTERVDAMMNNKVNIERLQKDVDRISIDVEKLKDSVRANIGKLNGNSH
jgi:chaperonin cofactor prefoldin